MGELYRETRAKHQIQYLIIRHECQREKEDEFLFVAAVDCVTSSGYLDPDLNKIIHLMSIHHSCILLDLIHHFGPEGADIVWITGSTLEINLERKPFIINSVIIALTSLGCFYEENQKQIQYSGHSFVKGSVH